MELFLSFSRYLIYNKLEFTRQFCVSVLNTLVLSSWLLILRVSQL